MIRKKWTYRNGRGKYLASKRLTGSNLSKLDLSRSVLKGAAVSGTLLVDTDLSYSDLSDTDFSRSNMTRANLDRSLLQGTILKSCLMNGTLISGNRLTRCDLSGAKLSGNDLRFLICCETDFSGADLAGADLGNGSFRRCRFRNARLAGANLAGADLTGSTFEGADLQGADLRRARLHDTNFHKAKLGRARLYWARGLTRVQKISVQDLGGNLHSPTKILGRSCYEWLAVHRLAQVGFAMVFLAVGVCLYFYQADPRNKSDRWLINHARDYASENKWGKSNDLYLTLLDRHGQTPFFRGYLRVYSALASNYQKLGRYPDALNIYQNLKKAHLPPDILADMIGQMRHLFMDMGKPREANEHFQLIVKEFSGQTQPPFNVQMSFLEIQELQEGVGPALATAEKLLEEHRGLPDRLAQIHNRMGRLCLALNRLPDAAGHFRTVLEKFGDDSRERFSAQTSLLEIQELRGEMEPALAAAGKLLREHRGFPDRLAQIHNRMGRLCLALNRLPDAAGHFRTVLDKYSGDPWERFGAQMSLLEIQELRGETEPALATAEKLLKEHREFPDRLAQIHNRMGRLSLALNQLPNAAGHFRTVLDKYGHGSRERFDAQMSLLEIQDRRGEAVTALDMAEKLLKEHRAHPDRLARIHNRMGRLSLALNRLPDAAGHFRTVLDKYSGASWERFGAQAGLLLVQENSGEEEAALTAAGKLLEEHQGVPGRLAWLQTRMGWISLQLDRWTDAAQHFQIVLDKYPGEREKRFYAQMGLLKIQERRREEEEALVMAEKLLEEYQGSPGRLAQIYNLMGQHYLQLDRWTDAAQHFQIVLDKYPGNPWERFDSQMGLLEVQNIQEDAESALTVAEKLLEEHRDFPDRLARIHNKAGLLCLRLGRRPEAAEHFQAVIDRFDGNPWQSFIARRCLIEARKQTGQLKGASRTYQDFSATYKTSPHRLAEMHDYSARLFLRAGLLDAAAKDFQFIVDNYPVDSSSVFWAHVGLLEIEKKAGRYEQASHFAKKLISRYNVSSNRIAIVKKTLQGTRR